MSILDQVEEDCRRFIVNEGMGIGFNKVYFIPEHCKYITRYGFVYVWKTAGGEADDYAFFNEHMDKMHTTNNAD